MSNVTPIGGNGNFTSVTNTTVEPSVLLSSVQSLNLVSPYPVVSIANTDTSGASGDLTAAQLETAYRDPFGLHLLAPTSAATVNLLSSATTAAAALAVQQALGLTAVGQGRMLKFFITNEPGAALSLGPNSSNVTVTALGEASAVLSSATGVTGGAVDGTILVYVQATNVTSGSEAVKSVIVKGTTIPA